MERVDVEALQLDGKLHREWALRFGKDEKYEAAIDAFTRSMEEDKRDDLRRLLGFCRALVNFTRYQEADKIAQKCLEIEPGNYEAKWMRVETLYKIGEFGESLVHAYPGYQSHQCRYPFEDAIYRANDTIENCIGSNTMETIMIQLLPWIKKLENKRCNLIAKLSDDGDEFEGINEDHTKFRVDDLNYQRDYKMKKFDKYLTIRYLEYLSTDKLFLDKVLAILSKQKVNKERTGQLLTLIQQHLTRLIQIKDVHRIQRPIYTTYFKTQVPIFIIKRKNQAKNCKKYNIIIEVNFLLNKLHDARMKKDYSSFFKLVERIKDKLDMYPSNLFPMKKNCLNELYKIVGKAYIDPRNVTKIKNKKIRECYLSHHIGIKKSKLPRDEDLAWLPLSSSSSSSNNSEQANNESTLEIFRKRLALTFNSLELAWIYHEFSKHHIQLGRLELARFYAKKSRENSYKANSDIWTINANHLLTRIEIHQHNKNEAKETALMAYLGAKKIGLSYLEDFYQHLVLFIRDFQVDILKTGDREGIKSREKLMIQLMSTDKLKKDMINLLDRMNVVPAKKRLSVMPGCKPVNNLFKISCKRKTVKTDNDKNLIKLKRRKFIDQFEAKNKIPGFMDFED